MELDFGLDDKYEELLPKITKIPSEGGYPINLWTIEETNSQLSYLTHGFFRYYGKFPSTLASQLITQYPAPKDGILIDNFSGSGTSLVEASRRGIKSVGIDINPIAILAGRVKTKLYNVDKLNSDKKTIISCFNKETRDIKIDIPLEEYLDKWFFNETIQDIVKLKNILLELKNIERDFFVLAFFSIIRRISRAYDGEVRPHVNKKKKMREVFSTYIKKVDEMIYSSKELKENYPNSLNATTLLIDNRLSYINNLPSGNYWLAISHPPYLNCFDYIPVYKLELSWSVGFEWLWDGVLSKDISKKELKSWPAKDNIIESYYNGLQHGYRNLYEIQPKGGVLAVVIGDCTINGKLEKVHQKLIDKIQEIGYSIIELNYRTTYYTTGKYSYQNRANYHGDDEKKDAIIVFRK